MKTEFEVKIRDGKITSEGFEVLGQLQSEFNILQYKENLQSIVQSSKIFCSSDVFRSLLDVVYDDILESFHDMIRNVQNKVSSERKEANRNLCFGKCKDGPVVHNFTKKIIPPQLLKHLVSGLNNVPHLNPNRSDLKLEIEQEAVQACICKLAGILSQDKFKFKSESDYNSAIIPGTS